MSHNNKFAVVYRFWNYEKWSDNITPIDTNFTNDLKNDDDPKRIKCFCWRSRIQKDFYTRVFALYSTCNLLQHYQLFSVWIAQMQTNGFLYHSNCAELALPNFVWQHEVVCAFVIERRKLFLTGNATAVYYNVCYSQTKSFTNLLFVGGNFVDAKKWNGEKKSSRKWNELIKQSKSLFDLKSTATRNNENISKSMVQNVIHILPRSLRPTPTAFSSHLRMCL